MAASVESELEPSVLGTKEYWDETYERELHNFQDIGDVGEIWFGKKSIGRVVNWLLQCSDVSIEHNILDIGCGNGMMLIELAAKGFKCLTGIDYSDCAIQLASALAQKEKAYIMYQTCDILHVTSTSCLSMNYDIVIDKGTYDAICLNNESPQIKRHTYKENVYKLLKATGMFLITSCNWTKDELIQHFSKEFTLFAEIPTPTFTFGGKSGNNIVSLVFKKT